MADIVLTANTNASSLTINPEDNICLNGYTLTLDADIVCNIISGGANANTAGAGRISVPEQTRSITCAKIGLYNSTTLAMFVFTAGANLTLTTTEFLDATRLVSSISTNTITLTLQTPADDYSTILTCPSPPVSYTSSFINVDSSGSVVNLRGIFRGQQSGTNVRAMFSFGSAPTVSASGCFIGGAVSSTNSVVSTSGGIAITAFTSGAYAGKALIANSASPIVLTASALTKQIVINGDVYGSSSAGAHGLVLNQTTPTIINGDVYGGSNSSADAYGVSVDTNGASLTVNGTVYGGLNRSYNFGIYIFDRSGCSITVNKPDGNALRARYASALRVLGSCSGTTVTVYGNVVGGNANNVSIMGLYSTASGCSVVINGTVIGGSSTGGYCYGAYFNDSETVIINGKCLGGSALYCYGLMLYNFTGSATINAGSDGIAAQGGTASTTAGIVIAGASTGQITINGNAQGGSSIIASGLRLDNMVSSVITVNGSIISGSYSSAHGCYQVNSGDARVYVNGNIVSGGALGLFILAGSADYYIGGDIVKTGSALTLQNTASTAATYVCVAYGRGYKDGSGNPLALSDVANANSNYPNSGYGWVVNAKLENAADFITAMTQLPYGAFIINQDLSVSSTAYTPTVFYGSLLGRKGRTVPKLTTLSLSNSGSGQPLTSTNNGVLENIQIISANTGSANILATVNNGVIKRCFVQSGSGGPLAGSNGSSAVIFECYSRIGQIVPSADGTISRCYKSVNDSSPGDYLTDAQAKQKVSYVDWNFNTVWDINEGVGYPFLRFRQPPASDSQSSLPRSWAFPVSVLPSAYQYKPIT